MDRAPDRRYDELAALYRVASLSTSQGDPRAIMNEVVRVVESSIECESALMLLYDEKLGELRPHGPTSQFDSIKISEAPFLRRILQNRVSELTNDVAREVGSTVPLIERLDARHVVAAPLGAGGKALGILLALNSRRGAFDEADLRLLTIVADRAALTIENAQLVATLQRQVQELEGMQQLSTLLLSTESLDRVVGEAIRIVSAFVRCDKMAVLLHDTDEDALIAHESVIGMTPAEVAVLRVSLDRPSFGATVFRTNTPLMSNDAPNDAWVNRDFREALGVRSLLVAPLAAGPRPIGILTALNAEKGFFDDDDLRFTTLLGSRVGSVVEANLARERERSLMRQLRDADRTKTEFVSMLAHELRGPMTTVMGFGYTLRDQSDALTEEKKKDVLRIIIREVERLSRMVTDLLDVSRMESGIIRYELEPMSLPELLHSTLAIHTSFQASHMLEVEIDPALPKVIGDKDRISQVLINLLTNAIRYSPEGTTISVRARAFEGSANEVHVSVTDQGIGIASDDQERIFEKFSMLPKPVWVKKGTGLGLFITKGIIDAHRGRLWIDSEVAKGTTFNFTLPVATDEAPA